MLMCVGVQDIEDVGGAKVDQSAGGGPSWLFKADLKNRIWDRGQSAGRVSHFLYELLAMETVGHGFMPPWQKLGLDRKNGMKDENIKFKHVRSADRINATIPCPDIVVN